MPFQLQENKMIEENVSISMETLNEKIRTCERCRLSLTRKHALCGEGRLDARLMLIAQAPGQIEDEEGSMFIGPSGKVLNELLGLVSVSRSQLYMTNLVKCMLPKYRKPKEDEINTCSEYLNEEIALVNPKTIVTLGYYASRCILEKYEFPVPSRKEFRNLYGKLFWTGEKRIYCIQHLAALLHNPEIKDVIVQNYRKLRVLSRDCKWYPVCPMKSYHEAGKLPRKWVELYCKGDWESCVRYQKEENGEWHPDYMLPDGTFDKTLRVT